MKSLSLPQSIISQIVNDPSLLSSSSFISSLPHESDASFILLHGYTKGFRDIFILNACLAAVATITSITMIKHKELTRADDEKLKLEGKRAANSRSQSTSVIPNAQIALDEMHVAQAGTASGSGTATATMVDVEAGIGIDEDGHAEGKKPQSAEV
jgi:hypothetical protein